MMKKKQQQEDPTNFPVVNHDENDINELESFCRKYGIIGFNCGRMSPKAALRMLKMRMGIPNEEKQIVSPRQKESKCIRISFPSNVFVSLSRST